MRGRLVDLSFTRERKQRVTVELDEDFTEAFDQLHEGDVAIDIKRFRQKRSLDANAYAWVLINKVAATLGLPKAQVYRGYIRDIGGNCEIVCVPERGADKLCECWALNGLGWQAERFPSKIPGCVNVALYYGSSTYDTAQMSRLIDLIIEDCRQLGIETLPPYKLAALLEGWDK